MNPQVLEKYRKNKKITCSQLCEKMGKTGGWYSRIRSGEYPLRTGYIPQMAEIFGVTPEKLAKEYFSKPKLEESASPAMTTQ